MTSEAQRDPYTDHLLTPTNSAIIIIDYQPTQIRSIRSAEPETIVRNIVLATKTGVTFGLPIVVSTVNVETGVNQPTIPELRELLPGTQAIDRTTINAWEDIEFRQAVEATGRRKLIMAALWTEVCLAFPGLDLLRDGFDVYPIVDAVAGTSVEAHQAGLQRLYQAGATPVTVAQLGCELQRDWARTATVAGFREILTLIEADHRDPVGVGG